MSKAYAKSMKDRKDEKQNSGTGRKNKHVMR
jgi:hypothetical protein